VSESEANILCDKLKGFVLVVTVPPSDLIPVPNLTTSDPNEVYSRDAIIPPNEWSALDVSGILKARDDRGRAALLPWRRSRWIEDKMRGIVEGPMSGSAKRSAL
jgi:DNA-directed RNA polymerase I subunit RPA49